MNLGKLLTERRKQVSIEEDSETHDGLTKRRKDFIYSLRIIYPVRRREERPFFFVNDTNNER